MARNGNVARSTQSTPPRLSDNAKRTWQTLTRIYGERFVANYGESPPDLWARAIDELTAEQLSHGFRVLKKRAKQRFADNRPDYPPTFYEFCAACESHEGTRKQKLPDPHRAVSRVERVLNIELLKLRTHGWGAGLLPVVLEAKAELGAAFVLREDTEGDSPEFWRELRETARAKFVSIIKAEGASNE